MVWKSLQAQFSLENGLKLVWSEVNSVWDSLIRGELNCKLFWSETISSSIFVWNFYESCWLYPSHAGLIKGHFWSGSVRSERSILHGQSNQRQFWSGLQPGMGAYFRIEVYLPRNDGFQNLSAASFKMPFANNYNKWAREIQKKI